MKTRRYCLMALLWVCLLLYPVSASTVSTVRVGLYYGDNALTSANLANINGSGFRFGYYNNKTTFVPLGQTSQSAVTMVITDMVYLSGNDFSLSANSGTALGPYHAIHSTGYASYDSAYAIASSLSSGFVAWINGDFQVRSGSFSTSEEATIHANAVGGNRLVAGTSAYAINMVKTGSTELIFQFDGGTSYHLAVEQDLTGNSDPQVWFKNIKYRGGFQYQRVNGGNMVVSNVIAIETYLKGVVPFEMSGSWPLEALKAQAVCARTYAVRQVQAVRHSSENFDLCNTACCQVYYGNGGPNTQSTTTTSDRAVEETANMYLWYGSSLAGTYYSSSHGGASEAVSNVWTSSNQASFPYLTGVIDPYEKLANNINSRSSWTVSFTKAELESMLQGKGFGIGTEVQGVETCFSPTGNVISLIVHWTNGKTNSFTPTELRYTSWFALPSIHFVINETLPTVVGGGTTTVVPTIPQTSYGYTINNTTAISSLSSLYAIAGDGSISPLPIETHVITGKGSIDVLSGTVEEVPSTNVEGTASYSSNLLTGTRLVSADVYHFNGSGWGHNIGMSQFGAYAMAYYENLTYDTILEFYFPNTSVKKG